MTTLVDTNVLIRTRPAPHVLHQAAWDAVAVLRQQGDDLVVAPQNLYEFWVVATRPIAQNGLGLSVAETQAELTRLKSFCTMLQDTPAIFPLWEQLVAQHQVLGKNAHDARLVAAMVVHGVDRLLTFNAAYFQRFSGITILTPQQVLASTPPPP